MQDLSREPSNTFTRDYGPIPISPDLDRATGCLLPQPAITGLSPKDQRLFAEFGMGTIEKPRFPTIHAALTHFIARQPEATAAIWEGETITYGALDAAANRLAGVLADLGIGRGDAVGLYLRRSIPMLVGLLAVLKRGAAYVPQDVGVATESMLSHISTVTGATVVLTLESMADAIPVGPGQTVIPIDTVMADLTLPAAAHRDVVRPDDICLILFTSGTTGVPNGVQVTHRNLCNILQTAPGDLGIRPGSRVGQILSIAFDMAAWEMLGCLGNGGTLVIRGKSIQDTAETVDVLIATPSILNALAADRCRQVKTVAVAGEPCPRPLADLWGGFCRFYNSCGPTETTIINTAERHSPDKDMLTIGRPTPNNTVYILDDNLMPLPIGATGELWAGGDCVTAGYLANDGLNADRYRPDPFLGGDRMMFRTRDLGRWTDTGELLHLGRVDDLVKIKGFRVELDGVTSMLEATPGCKQAVTLKHDNETLVAFVSPGCVDPERARALVGDKLPYYNIPEFVLPLERLPRTARGKIDKRRLRALADAHVAAHRRSDGR